MNITKRDLELFQKLSSHGMLSTKQINVLFFNSIAMTTVLRRLRLLEDNYYLKRLIGLESKDILWILTQKGADIAELEIPKRHWSKNMLEHDLKLLSLRLLLERSGIAHSWMPEHQIRSNIFKKNGLRAAKEKLIPDGLMGIEVNGRRESVAIELELTLKNKDKLNETVRRYQAQGGILGVWYIAPTLTILKAVHGQWQKPSFGSQTTKLYLSLLEDVMKDPIQATFLGSKPLRVISELWTIKSAHQAAQEVSSQVQKPNEEKPMLTDEDRAPILMNVS